MAAYDSWSTDNGDPALGRYAGVGVGIGFRDARRVAASEVTVAIVVRLRMCEPARKGRN